MVKLYRAGALFFSIELITKLDRDFERLRHTRDSNGRLQTRFRLALREVKSVLADQTGYEQEQLHSGQGGAEA